MWATINSLLSPKKFFFISNLALPWLTLIFLTAMMYGVIDSLFFVPPDYLQGHGFRIIYVHVPSALLSLFIYAVMSVAAILVLIFRLKLASLVLRYSPSLGAIFTLLALLTGSLWGKPMWGTWWIWDARLTSEFILFFIYLGIIFLQSALHTQKQERAVAILTLVGMIDLPIIHYSVYWWNTLHQGATLRFFSPSLIDRRMLMPLIAMIIAFFTYYIIVLLLKLRYHLVALDNHHHWLEQR